MMTGDQIDGGKGRSYFFLRAVSGGGGEGKRS